MERTSFTWVRKSYSIDVPYLISSSTSPINIQSSGQVLTIFRGHDVIYSPCYSTCCAAHSSNMPYIGVYNNLQPHSKPFSCFWKGLNFGHSRCSCLFLYFLTTVQPHLVACLSSSLYLHNWNTAEKSTNIHLGQVRFIFHSINIESVTHISRTSKDAPNAGMMIHKKLKHPPRST